jgi:arabinofuranosyltransferase
LIPEEKFDKIVVIALITLMAVILIRTAWVSDDAYITLRTISNFARGQGLTWNVVERVQSYTHPLWMATLGTAIFFTNEFHLTTMFTSIFISVIAAYLLCFRASRNVFAAILGGTILILSKAYVDFSTSGLENPLSHLLLVVFFILLLRYDERPSSLFIIGLIASLAFLNRPDSVLLFYPGVLIAFLRHRSRRHLTLLLVSQFPIFLWEFFSVFYYGLPFPNTALAKLNVGIPTAELVSQGSLYLLDSIERDPLTLIAIFVGLSSVTMKRSWERSTLAAGIILYLMYIVRIGGDFMSGRFLTLPLIGAVLLLSDVELKRRQVVPLLGLVILLGFSISPTTISSDVTYGQSDTQPRGLFNGIIDERGFYYQATGLLRFNRNEDLPRHLWVYDGIIAKLRSEDVIVRGAIGFFGFYAGPDVYIVDVDGLANPLLARLPIQSSSHWRSGHFKRTIPAGYIDTLKKGSNLIEEPHLAEYYGHLELIMRGALFDPDRIRAIWLLNTGSYNHLLEAFIQSESHEYSSQAKH